MLYLHSGCNGLFLPLMNLDGLSMWKSLQKHRYTSDFLLPSVVPIGSLRVKVQRNMLRPHRMMEPLNIVHSQPTFSKFHAKKKH